MKRSLSLCMVLCMILGILTMNNLPVRAAIEVDQRDWMTLSYETLKDKKLYEITLPGTHDSGTYNLSILRINQVSKDIDGIKATLLSAPVIKDIFKDITRISSITQEKSIYEQLREGIREFDIRFKTCNSDGKLRIFHGMFGDTFDEVASQINRFMNENPDEVVFINLNMAGEMWDFRDSDRRVLGQKFMNAFGQRMIGPDDGLSFRDSTFSDIIEQPGKRMVVTCIDDVIRGAMSNTYSENDTKRGWIGRSDIDYTLERAEELYYEPQTESRYTVELAFSLTPGVLADRLLSKAKKLDFKGMENILKEQLSMKTLNHLASDRFYEFFRQVGQDGYKPISAMVSDFYEPEVVALAILRNYGKTKAERYAYYKEFEAKTLELNEPRLYRELGKMEEIRRITFDLEREFMDNLDYATHFAFGGNGGSPFQIFTNKKDVAKVAIRCHERVDAIAIDYYDDGKGEIKAGGDGGSYKSINLDRDEYITEVYTSLAGVDTIKYIEIKTSKGKILTGGEKTGRWSRFKAPEGWKIVGFHGRSGKELDKLGFVCKPIGYHEAESTKLILGDKIGSDHGGSAYNFMNQLPENTGSYQPTKIFIRSGHRVDRVGIVYNNISLHAGGSGGDYKELTLNQGEYITKALVSLAGDRIGYIKFTTSQGRTLEGGRLGDNVKNFWAPFGKSIVGFYGRSGKEVDQIGFIFGPTPR